MADIIKFDESKISDQKRLVRGEQLLAARTALRIRDGVHHGKWRVLMMAGGSPQGEVRAIRELMKKAHITAVDNNQHCLTAAIEAGVDDVVQCDLADFSKRQVSRPWAAPDAEPVFTRCPAEPFTGLKFDIVDLDLCGSASLALRDIVMVYRQLVTKRGVMILTFSYGRDVSEVFHNVVTRYKDRGLPRLLEAGIPDPVLGRVLYVLSTDELRKAIRSVALYKGSEMPMCSVLMHCTGAGVLPPVSFVKIEPGDYELAVTYPDAAELYDCPRERIESLRRKFAAIKASFTRSSRRDGATERVLPLLRAEDSR